MDIVEAAVKFHKRQSDTIHRKVSKMASLSIQYSFNHMQLQQLEVDNKMDPVKIQQLKQSLRDKAQSVRGDVILANMN